jgi:hypothetical protein
MGRAISIALIERQLTTAKREEERERYDACGGGTHRVGVRSDWREPPSRRALGGRPIRVHRTT